MVTVHLVKLPDMSKPGVRKEPPDIQVAAPHLEGAQAKQTALQPAHRLTYCSTNAGTQTALQPAHRPTYCSTDAGTQTDIPDNDAATDGLYVQSWSYQRMQ